MEESVHLQLNEVPEYLRDSVLFSTLRENASDNPEKVFAICSNKLKLDPENITTLEDYTHMMNTLLFWDSPALPAAVISFALEYSGNTADLFDEKAAKLPQIRKLKAVLHKSKNEFDRALVAARVGSIDILKKLFSRQHTKTYISLDAASGGNLECLQYVHENGCPWNVGTCEVAAAGGNLECLQYAHENGCPWDASTCYAAARGGHLECLQYAHFNGCPWGSFTCSFAARGGHIECLKFAHSNGCPWYSGTCKAAAAGGHLGCLKYAHENGCPWDSETCSAAAKDGYLECLKYAHENGCPWDYNTCKAAADGGYLECLQYAHSNGCPWRYTTCEVKAAVKQIEVMKYMQQVYEYKCQLLKVKLE